MNRYKTLLLRLTMALILLLFASGLYIGYTLQSEKITHHDISITVGSSSHSIARQLEKEGVIHSALLFRWLARLSGEATKLKPGFYRFEGALNTWDILNLLSNGKVQQFKVTIPEGLRMDEVLSLLAKRTFTPLKPWQTALQNITAGNEPEGLFLPDTYLYHKPVNPISLLKQMFHARQKVEQDLTRTLRWSTADVQRNRIMASIIEKETALPHERVWVSAAIHNRLRLGMPLQMDPTVIYGIYRSQGSFSGNIRRQDLRNDTPWNTYTRKGLPLTPICNPGAKSLRAAAYPAKVDYLYFVADGTGGHAFASNLKEHNANVRKWINIERQPRKK